jgi:hypothetical protein
MIDSNKKAGWACPLNGKACNDGVREDFPEVAPGVKVHCRWWQHVLGKDPQTQKEIDNFDCAVAWLPVIGIENSQMTRHAAASADKVANEVAQTKQAVSTLSRAVAVAAESIRQGIEQGAIQVMLPSPGIEPPTNGHDHPE